MPAEGNLIELSEQLYAVVSMLTEQGSLRRALSDPSTPKEPKVRVVDSLLGERLAPAAQEVVRQAVAARWSAPRDLLDALEELAVDAALGAAEAAGELDEVEDELFRFERLLDANPDLRSALTNRGYSLQARGELLHTLLDGKVSDVTLRLVDRAVLEPRGRTIERALGDLTRLAAQRRERLIAHVTTAVELTEDEQRELADALARVYDHGIRLQVIVDPALIGGLTVRIDDEIIDASVARQLAEARRRLTGSSGARPARA
jgi:F-type H+-transporting ATPase subunit delta